jgi:hypothetical protein
MIVVSGGNAASGIGWSGIASDATGSNLIALAGDIWTSQDAGLSWTNQTAGTPASGQGWLFAASDATGINLVAAVNGGDLWTSTDSGTGYPSTTDSRALLGSMSITISFDIAR